MEEVINNLPVFNNGRRFRYGEASSYKAVQYPYRNFFYDPATTAESEFQFPSFHLIFLFAHSLYH